MHIYLYLVIISNTMYRQVGILSNSPIILYQQVVPLNQSGKTRTLEKKTVRMLLNSLT